MSRWVCVAFSVATFINVGCYQETSESLLDNAGLETEGEGTQPTWAEIAPGVWERPRSEGGFERMGFGAEGFQWALERAHQERVELLGRQQESKILADRLQKNQDLIDYLQTSIDKANEADEHAPLSLTSTDVNSLAAPSPSPSAGVSDSVCGGYYGFNVDFYYNMAGGSVEATASWTEFGPYAPYYKTFHTYAWGLGDSGNPDEDADSIGPFRNSCCVSVGSSAAAYPTFAPQLYGSAYLSVTNGCSASRFYELSNY